MVALSPQSSSLGDTSCLFLVWSVRSPALMQAVLFKIPGQEWQWLGGMTLLERNLRLLSAAGVKSALILYPPGDRIPALAVPRELKLEVFGSALEIGTTDPLTILPALRDEVQQPFFLFD